MFKDVSGTTRFPVLVLKSHVTIIITVFHYLNNYENVTTPNVTITPQRRIRAENKPSVPDVISSQELTRSL